MDDCRMPKNSTNALVNTITGLDDFELIVFIVMQGEA
jgi:hypothetical protein